MSKEAPAPDPQGKTYRDVRVDRIGFVSELAKHYIEGDAGVKAKVKAQIRPGDTAVGDFFQATLCPSSASEVSVSGLLKLYENQTISRSELVECLSASKTKVDALRLPKATHKRLVKSFVGTPRLNVDRIKGKDFELGAAVAALHAAITGDDARKAVASQLLEKAA